MKTLYLLWNLTVCTTHPLGVYETDISCDVARMEAAADTGQNLKEFTCVLIEGGRDA